MPKAIRVITYIDGFNLYFGLRSKYGRKYLWLDIEKLAHSLIVKPNASIQQVKYFTARIRNSPAKEKRQNQYLEAIETLPSTQLIFGKYYFSERECPACHHKHKFPSEKMTDVNIAVNMLVDAYEDRYDLAYLISGDSDLSGPIQEIRKRFPEKIILAAFPPDTKSWELARVANNHFMIGERKFARSQFPEKVTSKSGHELTKPTTWK
ncbi:MAG: NYN domain-containing protein [Chloroflexota bacterium]